jgi:catechol 2,3-dioxygenase-like lactoylglutathione lyase family enzyme
MENSYIGALIPRSLINRMQVNSVIVMEILGFDHIHFTVKDLEEAIEFYRRLGFELLGRLDHAGESAQMRAPGGLIVDLHPAKATDNPGYNHFAVTVRDLDAMSEGLEEMGIDVDGPVDVPATGRRLATIRDPSGFLIQLVEAKEHE